MTNDEQQIGLGACYICITIFPLINGRHYTTQRYSNKNLLYTFIGFILGLGGVKE